MIETEEKLVERLRNRDHAAWRDGPHDYIPDDEDYRLVRSAFDGGWNAGRASQDKLIKRLIKDADEEKARADERQAQIEELRAEMERRERNENRNCLNWGPCSRHDERMAETDSSTHADREQGDDR